MFFLIILVIACTTFILILATMLAIAAPNLGNLIRYKTAFLPLLWFLLLSGNRLTDERLASWVSFLKK